VQIVKYWQYQDLDIVLELLTGTKKKCKIWIGKQGNSNQPTDSITQRQI